MLNSQVRYKNMSASALVKSGQGRINGIFVATTSSGTFKVWDNTSAATTILINTTTPAAASMILLPDVRFETGLYITIANTLDITVFYQ